MRGPPADRQHLADLTVDTTAGSPDSSWGPWASVSDGRTAPGGPVTAVALAGQPGRVALFVADSAGGVYITAGTIR